MSSLFEEIGGETVVRTIIDDFVERITSDMMIGFFFRKVDKARLKTREYEFTAQFLGAQIAYSGRPMPQAHAAHRIMGGQFDRRRQILKETLEKHGVGEAHQSAWLAHVDALRGQITGQGPGICR